MTRRLAYALAFVLVACVTSAQTKDDGPKLVTYSAWAGEEAAYTNASHITRFVAGLEAVGSIAWNNTVQARLLASLELRSLPGQPAVDLTQPETWTSDAELWIGAERPLASVTSGGQFVETSVVVRSGWSTAAGGEKTLARYPWQGELTLKLIEHTTGGRIEVGPGYTALVGGLCAAVRGEFPLKRADVGSGWSVATRGDLHAGSSWLLRLHVVVRK